MPTQTIPSALLKLYQLGVWDLPPWQDHTGAVLCFDDAGRTVLPKGWTAADLSNVKSFYEQYQAKPNEDAKIQFASGSRGTTLPGRKKWQTWVYSMCKTAKLHEIIAHCLSAANCHPMDVEPGFRKTGGPTYIGYCIDEIALQLFGADTLDQNGRLLVPYRASTQAIAQRTWYNLSRRLDRAQKSFNLLEEQAVAAFDGEHRFTLRFIYCL